MTSAAATSEPLPQVRIGVLVVAHNAAATLRQTLYRIPAHLREQLDHVGDNPLLCRAAAAFGSLDRALVPVWPPLPGSQFLYKWERA